MGQSCISKKLEGMAKHRDGQKNELSTLALKCFFPRIWPQAQSWHWETEEMTSPLDQPHFLGVFWVLRACQLLSSPLQM